MDNNEIDELAPIGADELEQAWQSLEALRKLRAHGRLWAIAATDAEKLYAWIGYAMSTVDPDD